MQQVIIDDRTIKYNIIRTPRKTIAILINAEQNILVRAPRRTTDRQVEQLIKKKASWIFTKLAEMEKIKPAPNPIEFKNGEVVPYLGRMYKLKLIEKFTSKNVLISLEDEELLITFNPQEIGHPDNGITDTDSYHNLQPSTTENSNSIEEDHIKAYLRNRLVKWYKKQARQKIKERVDYFSSKIGKHPALIRVKEQKKRWGSCSSKGNLNFNWKLITAPLPILDYIIVHELAHLVHHNHSHQYWKLVKSILPDYKEREEWLKVNGRTLTF